jgi:hypothetical protein
MSNYPFSHYLRVAVFLSENGRPLLYVSIMWFFCKLASLIRGIGACTLRAQWTSTSAVRNAFDRLLAKKPDIESLTTCL